MHRLTNKHSRDSAEPRWLADFQPVFIVGCERSGTTLLASLLDRHSELAVTPETHFLDDIAHQMNGRMTAEELVDTFVRHHRASDCGLNRERILRRLDGCEANARTVFAAALVEYAAKNGKSRPGEKTPAHLYFVGQLLTWFPRARVICIFRDGRDVALSLMNVPWTFKNLRYQCLRWRVAAQLMLDLQAKYPDRIYCCKFEDLVLNPVDTLTTLLQFIDLRFEADQLCSQRNTNVIPEWEREWKQRASQALDRGCVYAWRAKAAPHQLRTMTSMMQPLLHKLGYSVVEPANRSYWRSTYESSANILLRVAYYLLLAPARSVYKTFIKGKLIGQPAMTSVLTHGTPQEVAHGPTQ